MQVEQVFNRPYNADLVHQIVTAYMAGNRAGTKAQKTRSEVRGGGAKPWRQKGSGRARAGTIRSPLWRTGGVTFAAKPRDFKQKVNQKMYRAGVATILAELARTERLKIIPEIALAEPKTKLFLAEMQKYQADNALLILDDLDMNLCLAVRNLHNFAVIDNEMVDPVSLLSFDWILLTEAAALKLQGVLQ